MSTIFPSAASTLSEKMHSLRLRFAEIEKQISNYGYSAMFVMVNSGNLSVFGRGSRFSLLYDDVGFSVADASITTATHGQISSFEYLLQQDPDVLFVLDRAAATGETAAQGSARAVLDNSLMHQTAAYREERIIYVNPIPWYVASGGLHSTEMMIEDILSLLN